MAGLTRLLTKTFTAGAAIPARTIVKFGADDLTVVPAAGATDLALGVTTEIDVVAGEPVDVQLTGISEGRAGAAFGRGVKLTSDAIGRLVAAAPAAGANVQIVGIAFEAATGAGDIRPVFLAPSVMQG